MLKTIQSNIDYVDTLDKEQIIRLVEVIMNTNCDRSVKTNSYNLLTSRYNIFIELDVSVNNRGYEGDVLESYRSQKNYRLELLKRVLVDVVTERQFS